MLQEQVIKSEDSLVQPLQESMFYVAGKWGTTVSTHPTMLQEQVIKSEDSLVQPLQESTLKFAASLWFRNCPTQIHRPNANPLTDSD